MANLTTLAKVKSFLRLTSSVDDVLLQLLIDGVGQQVESVTNRIFGITTHTEKYSGNGKSSMPLRNFPITSVSSIILGVVPAPPSIIDFNDNTVYLSAAAFPKGRNNISITYEAGYATIPADIELAVLDTIALRYKELDRIGYQSKSLAGETVSFFTGDFSKTAETTINRYNSVVPA